MDRRGERTNVRVERVVLALLLATAGLSSPAGCAGEQAGDGVSGWPTGDEDPAGGQDETDYADETGATSDTQAAPGYVDDLPSTVEDDSVAAEDPDPQELLPYMVMASPDAGLAGWQLTPDVTVPLPVQPVFAEVGFPHVLPTRPRPLISSTWRPWSSGRAIALWGDEVLVIDTDADRLVVLDRTTGEVARTVPVGMRPEEIVVGPAGTAWISVRGAGEVVSVPPGWAEVDQRVHLGLEPMGLALDAVGGQLLVALRAEGRVVALEVGGLDNTGDDDEPTIVDVTSDLDMPRGLALDEAGLLTIVHRGSSVTQLLLDDYGMPAEDGERAVHLRTSVPYQSHLLQGRPGRTVSGSARAAVIHPETGAALVTHYQRLPGNLESMIEAAEAVVSPTNNTPVYYGPPPEWSPTHKHVARTIEASITVAQQGDGGMNEEGALPVRDPESLEPLNTLIDQPADINHHPTLSVAFVVGHGTDNVLMVNTAVADPMRSPLGLIDVGMGPKAIALSDDGRWAYVLSDHSSAVSEIDLATLFTLGAPVANAPYGGAVPHPEAEASQDPPDQLTDVLRLRHSRWASIGEDPLPDQALIGRRIFTFARNSRISGTSQFSCASCHIDGGEDQTVWFFATGPRQTPALAGRLEHTEPFNWNGTKDTLGENFLRTINRMGGTGLTAVELEALEVFLTQYLEGVPNPHAPPTKGLTPAQARGKAVFERQDVGCSGCHTGPALTDGATWELGTAGDEEKQVNAILATVGKADPLQFNTPSLRGLWHTAPYLHDGRAETLLDVLDQTAMGNTDQLSLEQKLDLVEYLRSL